MNLHFFDPQLLTSEELEVGSSTGTKIEERIDQELAAAAAAAGAALDLIDLQDGPLQRRALGTEVEAEPQRLGDDARQLAKLQANAGHPLGQGLLFDRRDDALGHGKLVHAQQRTVRVESVNARIQI